MCCRRTSPPPRVGAQAASHGWGTLLVSALYSSASEQEENFISVASSKHQPRHRAGHHHFLVLAEQEEANLTAAEALALGLLPGAGPGLPGGPGLGAPV